MSPQPSRRRPLRWRITLSVLVFLPVVVLASFKYWRPRPPKPTDLSQVSSVSAEELLSEADKFQWILNGPKAAPMYSRAERLFAARGDTRDQIYAHIGYIRTVAETIPMNEASHYFDEQLQTPLLKSDKRLRLWCLTSKGYTDLEINTATAKADWLEAHAISEELGEKQWAARANGELGIIAFLEGETGKGASLVSRALLSAIATGDAGAEIRYLEILGQGFDEVNRHSEAIKFFDRAIKRANETEGSGFPFMAYEGKGYALEAMGQTAEGEELLQTALTRARTLNKPGQQSQILLMLGESALKSKNVAQAVDYFGQASELGKKVGSYRVIASAMFELAKIYSNEGNVKAAAEASTYALNASQIVGDKYYVPRDLTYLADLKAKLGDIKQAEALYEHAEDVIDSMVVNLYQPYWNKSLAGAMSDTYLHHFSLLAQQQDVPRAFAVLERVRGRTAAAILASNRSFLKEETPEIKAVSAQISAVQLDLMRTQDQGKREQLLDTLMEYDRRLVAARNELGLSHREFLGKPASLVQLQHSLRPDELFLEYVLDDPNVFCLAIAKDHSSLITLPASTSQVKQLVGQYLQEIRLEKENVDVSKRLYSALLAPVVADRMPHRIILSPDGVLNSIPFEALRDPNNDYLVTKATISYSPSATVISLLRSKAQAAPAPQLPLLALGDVPYQNQGGITGLLPKPATVRGRISRGLADYFGVSLQDLPETKEEVLNIDKLVGSNASTLLVGQNATEISFKRQPLANFRILHFAVHAFTDTQSPDRSGLVLGVDTKKEDDGLLQVPEIMRLPLNADLATLSACNTGVGAIQGEEGMTSLTEAFFIGGARAVVASLWTVDDNYTSLLMERFYSHLSKGEDKALALTNAKLDLLGQNKGQLSPYYWAGFTISGEASTSIPVSRP